MRVPRVLSERLQDVVCVAGEANAWPYAMRTSNPVYEEELVHWAAYRPMSGETLSCIIAPRHELAPGTAMHTGIAEASLRVGASIEELHARWRAFVRETDVICSWGRYETNLFARSGGHLPRAHVDLRQVARDVARGKVGSLSDYHDTVDADSEEAPYPSRAPHGEGPIVVGRAGRKLRAIRDIIASFTGLHSRLRATGGKGAERSDQRPASRHRS